MNDDTKAAQFIAAVREVMYGPARALREPTGYDMAILKGLQLKRHVYQGTVDPVTVAQRRRRNKVARRSRRVNRLAARG